MADRTQDRIGAPGSLAELQRELAGALAPSSVEELQRQFAAALEQQAATARILEVINHSRGDLEPVYQAVLDAAQRLLLADSAVLYRVADGELEVAALGQGMRLPGRNVSDRTAIDRATIAGQAALERRTVHVPDAAKEPHLPQHEPWARLGVPIVRTDELVGVITVAHLEAVPFTPRQISLLETFAGQVGIAIENARLLNETKVGLDRQSALAEILRVIAASPSNIQPVLDAVAVNAARFCGAEDVVVHVREGDRLVARAHVGNIPATYLTQITASIAIDASAVPGHAAAEKRSVHVPDIRASDAYPRSRAISQETGHRATLATPMLRGDEAIGTILLRRMEPRPFTAREIELVETFAAQAAIAIENVRLFNETKEGLDRQTAISEILQVISGSPTDVQPVLDAIAASAARFCGAEDATVMIVRDAALHPTAHHGPLATIIERPMAPLDRSLPIESSSVSGRAVLEQRIVQVDDILAEASSYPRTAERAQELGYRSMLAAPLMGEGRALGTILLRRAEPVAFDPKQVELLRTFADQAVIAMENVRLFNETKEALEQQRAMGDVLAAIGSATDDVRPVFQTILEHAGRLCEADRATIVMREDDRLPIKGGWNIPSEAMEEFIREPVAVDRTSAVGRAVIECRTLMWDDMTLDEELSVRMRRTRGLTGARSVMTVPLLREGVAIGAINLRRTEVRPFTTRQAALVESFAEQAVLAIENVRLFNETKEALAQQTATADVLKVISRSAFDLDAVFQNLLQNAVTICNADWGSIQRAEGQGVRNVAQVGGSAAFREVNERTIYRPGRDTSNGRALLEKRPIHIHDLAADPEYKFTAAVELGGIRTNLVVPMLRDEKVVGTFGLSRNEVRPFSEKEIALVSTFADQAAIAIENVRLFNETKEALERQTAVSSILGAISESPTDVQPVLEAVIENAVRLTGADNGSISRATPSGWRQAAHAGTFVDLDAYLKAESQRPSVSAGRGSTAGRVLLEKRTVQIPDLTADPEFDQRLRFPAEGARTVLGVPLMRAGEPLGVIVLRRRRVELFTEREIGLVETFAAQAAIAIENVRLFNETKESLERQTATSEVLRSISGSAFEIGPVFEAILDQSLRLCDAEDAMVVRAGDGGIRVAAHRGPVDIAIDRLYPMTRGLIAARAVMDDATVHVRDMLAEPAEFPESYELATMYGFRSTLATPLRRPGGPVGAILIRRRDIRPFSPEQIRLLETFADQAVIAIENVRLFNETKQGLDQQTAISEILRVISSSPTDVQPVLDAVASSARRFCQAEDAAVVLRREGDTLRVAAHDGPLNSKAADWQMDRTTVTGRSMVERRVVHVPDLLAESDGEYPTGKAQAREYGHRTTLAAPLLREGRALGALLLRRNIVQPFTDRQQDLVRTFAEQAAIAIENVRLFNETKEALDQQAATARVLQVISRSAFDLGSALETLVEEAARLCAADQGSIHRWDGAAYRTAAFWGPALTEEYKREGFESPRYPGRDTLVGRTALERQVVHIADATTDPEYKVQSLQKLGGYRTMLGVPLIRDGFPVGVFALMRNAVNPFSDRQIELVRTFADQAAIAIENVRLFNETKEALEQQTATSEVLKVISRSAFDVQPVLDAVVETAGRLVRADAVWLHRLENSGDRSAPRDSGAYWGATQSLMDRMSLIRPHVFGREPDSDAVARLDEETRAAGYVVGAGSVMRLLRQDRRTIHIHDLTMEPDLHGSGVAYAVGARTVVGVPLLRQADPVGFLIAARTRVEPFSDREIQLVETFSDQAAIAIENVRLFNEIQDKSKQLEVASRHKSEFLANMSHELRTPLNAIIGFTDVMLEEMFGPLNEKQKEYLEDVRNSGTHLLTLINDILDLSKVEAGRIELEIAEFSFPEALDNALTLVRERATRHGISLAADVAGDVGRIDADERKVKQVLVNLLANAVKFTPDGGRVTVKARRLNGEIEVAVHDTGIGVATEDQERIFDEFQQVGRDPERSREGTGLGLTLAKRFVELHGGRIWVESEVGTGSTFTFAIPVRQTDLAGAKA